MKEFVWVADWEMQCCGDPFAVGDLVEWSLTPATDQDWLDDTFGLDAVARITSYYDHHAEGPPPATVSGVVRKIRAVHCTYRQQDRTLIPVTGSATVTDRASATGWEEEREDEGVRFVGYLVELDAAP